ncbi:MAG: hypothetical protein IT393_00050 [Nitrospirae bacterium]|nr:hypothetical protein [Nitrospirota bacterium]
MDIIGKIMDIDCYLQSINASRSSAMGEDAIRQVELKRNVSHKINIPKRKSDHFSVSITDRITFNPDEGPFKIEIMLGANISLLEPMSPAEITSLIKIKKNVLSIINQCLPHSSAIIANITDKMGFSPVIFSPRIAMENIEFNNESRLSRR